MAKQRNAFDATGNGEVEIAVMRSRQLKEWIDGATKERAEIADKLGVLMEEHGCDAITLAGDQVARTDEYETESIKGDLAKQLKQKHPRVWNAFKTVGFVRRVTVG